MEKVICEVCNAPAAIKTKTRKETKYKNVPILLEDVSLFQCEQCGEEYLTPEQSHEFFDRVKEASRQKLGLLHPAEIVAMRNERHLNQDDLEELIGTGQKVVTRWERGEVLQPKPLDNLLRLIKDFPETVDRLRKYSQRPYRRTA